MDSRGDSCGVQSSIPPVTAMGARLQTVSVHPADGRIATQDIDDIEHREFDRPLDRLDRIAGAVRGHQYIVELDIRVVRARLGLEDIEARATNPMLAQGLDERRFVHY